MALKDLQQRLGATIDRAEALMKQEKLSGDESVELDRCIEEGAALKADIERTHKAEGIVEWGRKSGGVPPLAASLVGMQPAGAVQVEHKNGNPFVSGDGDQLLDEKTLRLISSTEYKSAYRSFLRGGDRGMKTEELKVLQEGADTAGGYLVPDEILARLIAKEPAPTSVAARVTRMQTGRDALVIPRQTYATDNIYTSAMRVTWTGEIPATATTHRVTEPTFGQARIPIYTAMMSLPVSRDMIEDAMFPIISWCTQKFGETIDLLMDNMVINGTGAGQPSGILRNPNGTDEPATVASGAAATVTADGLLSLAYALNEQYDQNAAFVMNKTNVAQAVAKLKDGDGRYIWGAGTQDSGLNVPAVRRDLLGYPVALNALMPNVGVGTYPIIFGDLRGYYLVTRVAMSIETLRELYAETNQILLLGRVRFGGMVVEPWRMKIQVCSA